MNMSEYLELNSTEKEKLFNFEIELKEEKLKNFFFQLLKHNQWDDIINILDKKVPFYELTKNDEIFNITMRDISYSLFKCDNIINNIHKIYIKEHFFIKEMLTKYVVENMIKIQEIPEVKRQDPFHIETISLAKKLLIENPRLSQLYKDVNIEEIKVIKNMVELNEKLPVKNQQDKKLKL